MRLTLERIEINNFKGTRALSIDFAAEKTSIFGMNGTGKTTIPDAFCWVLYNKDSHGNAPGTSNFREKPLDADGQEIHNVDTTVELICKLDGKPFNLRRTQRENWTKKRGSTTATYTGNTSTYWINDVEVALKDFKARIAEITSEEIFRLIGSLSAFNAQDWKKRREQLLALAGADVDEKLMHTEKYGPLAEECEQRNISIDELRKVLADQRKRMNTELQMIPVRIDEARKALPTFGPYEISNAEYIVQDDEKDLANIEASIAEAKRGTDGTMGQIVALEQEAASLTRQVTTTWMENKRLLDKAAEEASQDYIRETGLAGGAEARLQSAQNRAEQAEKQRDALREEYKAVYATTFQAEVATVCPTCGQQLPPDQVEAAREKARTDFATQRKEKLDGIKQRGGEKAKEVEAAQAEIEKIKAEIAEHKAAAEAAAKRRNEASEAIKAYPAEPDYSVNPAIEEIRAQIKALRAAQEETPDEKVARLERAKAEKLDSLKRHREVLARRDAGLQTEERIKALEAQQKEYGGRIAEVEKLISLAEKFVTDRCAALEESINACFPTVRWKLFDIQVNGGVVDCCTCMIPCETGLVDYETANTAAQVNADLEIINALSQHYDVYLPLFVDNGERVNVLAHTDSQLITLSVSTDSELTVKEE